MKNPKHILITGASSGIGKALALLYASPNCILSLSGRNEECLKAVVEACEAKGATVYSSIVDVCDADAMTDWVVACERNAPLDLVIANAGISGGTSEGAESADQVRQILDVNVNGVLNTVQPAQEIMQARRRGQIAIMSSLAGYKGWGSSPAYCSSKAAVRIYGEGLREFLHPYGVQVSIICPGFVRSPMTDVNDFPMPFLMEVDQAAQKIEKGLARNKKIIAFPWALSAFCQVSSYLPERFLRYLQKSEAGKPPLSL